MAVSKNLVSGSMTMLLLKLLSEQDMYGYEMISVLRERSENVFELRQELYIRCYIVWRRRIFWNPMSRRLWERFVNIIPSQKQAGSFCRKRKQSGRNIPRQ